MDANTSAYPYWNPGNSGAARNFADPVGVATATLAAALMESRVLQVPQEISQNQRNLSFMQYPTSATRIPAPQMPASTPTIPTNGSLLTQALVSLSPRPQDGK